MCTKNIFKNATLFFTNKHERENYFHQKLNICWFEERHVKDMIRNIDNEKGIKTIKNKLLLEVKSTFLNLGNNVIDPIDIQIRSFL